MGALKVKFAPPAPGPYAKDVDHMSAECYGADEDDIMYDVFARYRVEERNPLGAGTGVWKLPKNSGPQGCGHPPQVQRDEGRPGRCLRCRQLRQLLEEVRQQR